MKTDQCQIEVDALCNVHTHLREGLMVGPLVQKAVTGGADVLAPMPNTKEGLTTAEQVMHYVKTAQSAPFGKRVTFLPIVMVNEHTSLEVIDQCIEAGIVDCKVYPLNRTTKSHHGVRHYARLLLVMKHCGKVGMKCHFHPEHPLMLFDNRDAEFAFLPLLDMFLNETEAVIISEHGTDARCISFWQEMAKSGRFYVTLTAHHLASDEDIEFGNVRSVCKPPIKTRSDQQSLVRLVEEGYNWVMAGPDDAPHLRKHKHVNTGGCACGAYTAPFLMQLYAHALGNLLHMPQGVRTFVDFTSHNARILHQLPSASRKITLVKESFLIPLSYKIGPVAVEPFWAGQTIDWNLID